MARVRHLLRAAWSKITSKPVIPPRVNLGKDVYIGGGVELDWQDDGSHIFIMDEVTIAQGARILCHDASSFRRNGITYIAPVHVERRAFIGAGAIILPGITIGEDAIVGAGAVVTRNVDPGTIVAGVPAKPIGKSKDLDHKRLVHNKSNQHDDLIGR